MAAGTGANANPKLCLRSFQLGMRHAHGVHPRHPPRTFPLWLLAPRCLGLALLLALPHCRAGARAPACFLGAGGGSTWAAPPAPPRSFGVRPRTTPLLVFILELVVSLPLLDFCGFDLRRRSSFSHRRS